jgi:ankyrin repeat protein
MTRVASGIASLASLLVGAIALLNPAAGADWSPAHPGPFQPQLVTNNATICGSLLPNVRAAYLSKTPLVGSAKPPSISFNALTAVSGSASTRSFMLGPEDPRRSQAFVQPGGTRLVTYVVTLPGCGGACEGTMVLVSLRPISADVANATVAEGRAGPDIAETPGFGPWTVYRDERGYYYLAGVVDDQLQIFLIAPPNQWQMTCAISLAPHDLSKNSDAATRAAVLAVNQLTTVALTMEGADSNCGTSHTHDSWAEALEEELKETVYRPSAITPPSTADSSSPNSYGDYSRIADALADWSVSGIYEFRAFHAYQSVFHQAVQALSVLYASDYGSDPTRSTSLAEEKLRDALSYGFGFYEYVSFSDEATSFRRIILEHKPLAGLPSAPLQELNGTLPSRDALISLAVEYPAAVRLLLAKGAQPDIPNDFGKTPLMYAAQYNQLESARLLLDAGANPNAVTLQPSDTCEYSLGTTNVTALDYAARYASAAVIKLLLAHGAVTYIRSKGFGEVEGYPLDWLHQYAAASGGSNSNIKASEVPGLEQLLKVPTGAQLQQQAAKLINRAESLYAGGKPDSALGELKLALSADPDNDRGVADLPLIALRTGEVGVALEGTIRAIAILKTPGGRAAAWFNEGLACEKANWRWVTYDGKYYCRNGPIPSFINAWEQQPTPVRLSKLTEVLQTARHWHCVSGSGPSAVTYQFTVYYGDDKTRFEEIGRVYALHAADQHLDPHSISWSSSSNDPTGEFHVVSRIPLGAVTLTVMEGPYGGDNPRIDGKACTM